MRTYLLALLLGSVASASEQATRWNNVAALHHRQGQYAEAERLYRQAIAEWEQTGEGADLARGLSNLGSVAHLQGRFREAESLFRRSIPMLERHLGPDHSSVATTLNNLAELYSSQARFTEAEPLLERAIRNRFTSALWPSARKPSASTIRWWPKLSTIWPLCFAPSVRTARPTPWPAAPPTSAPCGKMAA